MTPEQARARAKARLRLQQQGGAQPAAQEPGYLQQAWNALKPGLNELTDLGNAADVLRVGANVVDLGAANYLLGPEEQQKEAAARARLGGGAAPLELGAGFLTPTGVPKRIQQGGRVISAIGHGISGGAQNVASEWTHGERDPLDLAKAAAVGSGLSGAVSYVADPIASYFSKRKAAAALPETKSLKAEGRQGYEDVKKAGGVYTSGDVRQLLAQFQNMNLAPGVDDRAIALRNWLDKNWQGTDVSPDKLDQMRRIVREKMRTGRPADKMLGEDFVKGMDKFAKTTPVKDAAGADIPGINETLEAARARYQQYFKAKEVDKAAPRKKGLFNVYGESSDLPAMKRFEKIDERIQSRGGQGFAGSEQQALKRAAGGSPLRDIGEWARKASPLRSPLPAGLGAGLGFLTGGVTWPAVAAGGAEALSALGRSATKMDIDELQSIIKTGKGLTADPAQVAALKDKLARMMSTATRTGYDQFGGPR